ncbi:MAG TPA: pyridoxine 5'-phosphate synthase [Polyangiaceae bacterium]|nr:pyridoxine 5'-phosphate synthase [Polyangiaceae bacterium]
MTNLSVNLNKFALLRNSRGGARPDVLQTARRCLAGGAHGITIHPRPDQRHARYSDVFELGTLLAEHAPAELNVEGAPSERFLEVVLEARPHQCTLVPDAPGQLTSDHGWDVKGNRKELERVIGRLHGANIRVSLFLDPVLDQVAAVPLVGADRIELYTAHYAETFGTPEQTAVVATYREAARAAQERGLGVNAGHDLDLENLGFFLKEVPAVLEVSIGHAFICEAIDHTLEGTLERYARILRG